MTKLFKDRCIGISKKREHFLTSINKTFIWIGTSGSMGKEKYIGLTEDGILDSARAVNNFFSVNQSDVFGCFIDETFIAGVALKARAFVANAKIVFGPTSWSPETALNIVKKEHVTITSLFPPQLFDLLSSPLPHHVRAILVGGGNIRHSVREDYATRLFQSYSLTEASSSVGVKKYGEEYFSILPHVEVKNCETLSLRGPSIARAVVSFNDDTPIVYTRNEDEWFQTSDIVELEKKDNTFLLKFVERIERVVKVRGRNIYLSELENAFKQKIQGAFVVTSRPHMRDDNEIILCLEPESKCDSSIDFSHVSRICTVDKIPSTRTGKVNYAELSEILSRIESPIS